jgi:predicted membrane metal-binding protein
MSYFFNIRATAQIVLTVSWVSSLNKNVHLVRAAWISLNSLLASALILTLLNPLILWDVGFQLSFMATLGLIVLVPPLERGIFNLLKRRLRTEQVDLTMALLSE